MKYYPALIAVIIMAFVVSGCSLVDTVSDKVSEFNIPGTEQEGAAQGTITASIVSPRQGAEIPKTSRLAPAINITNQGGYEAEGQACITGGLDKNVFTGFTGCECQSFKQEKDDAGKFEAEDLRFGPYSIKYKEGETKEHGFSTVTRFEYGVDVDANICIPEDVYAVDECGVKMKATGGPLQVTSIEEIINPGEDEGSADMLFKIHVSNEGGGRLITENDFNEPCKALSFEDLPTIEARVKNFPTNDMITCEDIEFEGNSAVIVCQGIVNLVRGGQAVFPEGYRPDILFQLRYFYELRQSSQFRLI
ncbi:MAG: hypothetical protein KJ955_01675 [Nanoarchaeota archaeon]|nr:hypothetical protein [Nanoarchaeota archaeon]